MRHIWEVEACLQRPNHQPICPAYWRLKKQWKPFGPGPSDCHSCLARGGGASDFSKHCDLPSASFGSGSDSFQGVYPLPAIGSDYLASAFVPDCD